LANSNLTEQELAEQEQIAFELASRPDAEITISRSL